MRRECKRITVRGVGIGGGERVTVQSMTNSDTADRAATLAQIKRLEQCGCDIVRFTVNSLDAVKNIPYYSENTSLPLVADIHFDYKLAVESAAAGINKIRINPGNIGGDDRVRKVVNACRSAGIPIRVGVNGGSLEKEILAKYGAPTAEALAESALENIKRLERFDFDDIVVSAKSSDVRVMINANRIIASRCNYPLHLGVTEAGALRGGTVKGAIGIGALLADGIGDTVRMSLSADIAAQVDMHDALTSAGIPHAYYRVDGVSDYLAMLEQFCQMTGREDLYEENGLAVQAEVDRVLEAVQDEPHPTVLLLRAFSSGAKAKGDDNLAGVILRDLGAENLVEKHESLLEDVSLEEVIAADPDFIFVVTMGSSEEAALDYMEQNFESNPAWAELTAVQEDHYVLLPKELLH